MFKKKKTFTNILLINFLLSYFLHISFNFLPFFVCIFMLCLDGISPTFEPRRIGFCLLKEIIGQNLNDSFELRMLEKDLSYREFDQLVCSRVFFFFFNLF